MPTTQPLYRPLSMILTNYTLPGYEPLSIGLQQRLARSVDWLQEDKLHPAVAPAPQYAARAMSEQSRDNTLYGSSYSGVSFASSFDPDNVAVDRHPQYSG